MAPSLADARSLFLVALILFTGITASAQVPEYQAKAEFLERFTRFIEWPPDSGMTDLAAPFVTCVLGHDPFGPHLDNLAQGRKIKGKPVEVRRLATADGLSGCHLVFIAASEAAGLKRALARIGNSAVLSVGDTPGFAQAGVLINLVAEGEKISFEVNESAVRKSGLQFNSRLMKLARVVEPSR